jgi:hypothetical protein
MFPTDCRYVRSLLMTIQFQLLYIHTSCPGDTWHSRVATRWSPPLAQEEQTRCSAAASGSTNPRHIARFLS